jgi:Cu/Ag efflux protein CusF
MTTEGRKAAMRKSIILAATTLAFGLAQGASAADPISEPKGPDTVSGEVTKIDPENSRVTVHSSDGSIHVFEASKQTLDELEVGDHIAAKKRPGTTK